MHIPGSTADPVTSSSAPFFTTHDNDDALSTTATGGTPRSGGVRRRPFPLLSEWEIGRLLRDVEASGQARTTLCFYELCNSDFEFYGIPGSTRRQTFQRKWYSLKKLYVRNYLKQLAKHGVAPSHCTHLEVRTQHVLTQTVHANQTVLGARPVPVVIDDDDDENNNTSNNPQLHRPMAVQSSWGAGAATVYGPIPTPAKVLAHQMAHQHTFVEESDEYIHDQLMDTMTSQLALLQLSK